MVKVVVKGVGKGVVKGVVKGVGSSQCFSVAGTILTRFCHDAGVMLVVERWRKFEVSLKEKQSASFVDVSLASVPSDIPFGGEDRGYVKSDTSL
jgi:hypothetical protein